MKKHAPNWFVYWIGTLLRLLVGVTATMFWVALVHEQFGFLAPIGFTAAVLIYGLPILAIGAATLVWSDERSG